MRNILKKIISVLLITAMLYTPAFAEGTGNGDSDSGWLGQGTEGNYWNPGDDGIRVTVVTPEGTQVGSTIDYSNGNFASARHFGFRSKISYRNNTTLTFYENKYASSSILRLPKIISENGSAASIEVIKDFICNGSVLQIIASNAGITNGGDLLDGKYKLIVEPIAYFHYGGVLYAMTATEAALVDQLAGGQLKSVMGNLTHKNLPLAMFLEWADLGFPSYKSYDGAFQTRANIITRLGILIWSNVVEEVEDNEPAPEVTTTSPSHYDFHTDTTVCVASAITNTSKKDLIGKTATLSITGSGGFSKIVTTTYTCPKQRDGYIWWYFNAPSTEQTLSMSVSFSDTGVIAKTPTITASVTKFKLEIPPDPKPYDTFKTWSMYQSNISLNKVRNNFGTTSDNNSNEWYGWLSDNVESEQTKYVDETTYWYNETGGYGNWSNWISVTNASQIPASTVVKEVQKEIKEPGWIAAGTYTTTTWPTSNSQKRYLIVSSWENVVDKGVHIYQTTPVNDYYNTYEYVKQEPSWSGWIDNGWSTTSYHANTSTSQWRCTNTGYEYGDWGNTYTASYDPTSSYYPYCCSIIGTSATNTPIYAWGAWSGKSGWVRSVPSSTSTTQYSITDYKPSGRNTYYRYIYRTKYVSYYETSYTYYYKTRSRYTSYYWQYRYFQGYDYYYRHTQLERTYNFNVEEYQEASYKYRYRTKKYSGYWTTSSEQTRKKVKLKTAWGWNKYIAKLTLVSNVLPDPIIPLQDTRDYIPSGYGVFAKNYATVSGNGASLATGAQTVYNMFPEFYYATNTADSDIPYGRFLIKNGTYWEYANNPYSRLNSKVHYTPVWYPDETEYKVAAFADDCWTPGGKLTASDIDSLWINESVYDDWIVRNSK